MTTLRRRSPKLAYGETLEPVRQAIETLEDRPRVPRKTPASQTADGYEGEVCQDDAYLYVYSDGFGWARIAKAW